eukprot:4044923-Pleurochrysis_carterae.AAC.1
MCLQLATGGIFPTRGREAQDGFVGIARQRQGGVLVDPGGRGDLEGGLALERDHHVSRLQFPRSRADYHSTADAAYRDAAARVRSSRR